ncbi:uncharacterized protein LOC121680814 isoform X2 [Alosa sapidissima]|uniref:uncharacterized protein LOC121680814 isoform X2 n=1 Tax=Alosa sapidissima TaxID=34773 RepID=UPI001C086191|nr:uncharacterized protein LOC121680814 isoform X2 [Alosa sapidissima]
MATPNNLFASFAQWSAQLACGSCFLFSRGQEETVEIGTQMDWETAEASTQAGWETADAGTHVPWETAEASTQAGWETADAGTQSKWETVEAGIQAECQRAEAGVQAVQETAVSATQAVWEIAEVGTQPDWKDGFIHVDPVTPQLVTLDGVDGQQQPSGWDVQTLLRYTMVYRSSTLFSRGPAMVGERRCSGETVEGSLRTQFWFTADENFVVDAEWRCGELVRAVSYHEQESKLLVLMDGVPVIQTSRTYKRVNMSANGSLVSSERSETTSVPAPVVVPDPSADGAADASGPTDSPGADASAAAAADDTQSSAQGSEDSCLLPEAREVPSLFNFFQSRRLEDFSTKLTALRQAFTILLSDDQQCNYASVAVRMILRNLATLNGRDADLFQRAFDDLVAYVQNPENALSIQVELLEARIHHITVLDIVFELVLFGMLDVARPQLVPRVQGGFLDQLLAVVHAFLPFEACSPAAHQYWQMLQADVRAFLEEVFSLDLSVYSRLQALADGLFSCLEQRVDQLLSTLPSP